MDSAAEAPLAYWYTWSGCPLKNTKIFQHHMKNKDSEAETPRDCLWTWSGRPLNREANMLQLHMKSKDSEAEAPRAYWWTWSGGESLVSLVLLVLLFFWVRYNVFFGFTLVLIGFTKEIQAFWSKVLVFLRKYKLSSPPCPPRMSIFRLIWIRIEWETTTRGDDAAWGTLWSNVHQN